MNTPGFIAYRYFFARRKRNFINIISLISVIGVVVGTASLVIVLSVFNGLETLIRGLFGSFDPELRITAVQGKSFVYTAKMQELLQKTDQVEVVTEVIEDNALLRYNDKQIVVKLKGVSLNAYRQYPLDSIVKEGSYQLENKGIPYALVGRGIQYKMGIRIKDQFTPLELWYPRPVKNITMDPTKAFNTATIRPSGIFAIEKQYDDNYLFVPIGFMQTLSGWGNRRSALELRTRNGDIEKVQSILQTKLGKDFKVQNSEEIHASLFKAVKIEKIFAYGTFTFILGISSLNIFFTLSMLAIEKKKDIGIMYALGATERFTRSVFLSVGGIIALLGAGVGMLLGVTLCWAQKEFGLVPMGMETSVVTAYPVEMRLSDFVFTGITIAAISLLASLRPAITAYRLRV